MKFTCRLRICQYAIAYGLSILFYSKTSLRNTDVRERVVLAVSFASIVVLFVFLTFVADNWSARAMLLGVAFYCGCRVYALTLVSEKDDTLVGEHCPKE
jgi:hypothetical protein